MKDINKLQQIYEEKVVGNTFEGIDEFKKARQDLIGHINGIKGWLDDFKQLVEYMNFNTADRSLPHIKKAFGDLEKSYKDLKKHRKNV